MTEITELERGQSAARLTALTGAWRDALAVAIGWRPGDFQLLLGAAGLSMQDAGGLMRYSDLVVPRGPVAWLDDRAGETRSEAYLQMLLSLLPATETGLRGLLGDQYASWITCRNADPRGGAHVALFRVWAANNLMPGRAEAAMRLYREELDDPLLRALDKVLSPRSRVAFVGRQGRIYRQPVYTASIDSVHCALGTARGATVRLDSDELPAVQLGQAGPGAGRARYFWSRSPRQSPALRALDSRALNGRITVEGRIGRVATIATEAGTWMDGFEMERAWAAGNDPGVWDEAAGRDGWRQFFGPDGSLARRIARIVLAGGYEIAVTSHARYSAEEVATVRSESTGGVWPMVAGASAPAHRVRVTHHPDGSLTHHLSLAPDRIEVLGGIPVEAPL